jgi:hypothetical protein
VAARLLVLPVAALLGAVAGLLGSFVHPLTAVGLPVGLFCGLALTVAATWTGGILVRSRVGAVAGGVGWVVPVLLLSAPRPEGDLVVTGSGIGYAWLLGGLLATAVGIAWPQGAAASAERPGHR